MKITKILKNSEIEFSYSDFKSGCRVFIKAKNPHMLMAEYKGNLTELIKDLENLSDEWIDELEKPVCYQHTDWNRTLLSDNVELEIEYRF